MSAERSTEEKRNEVLSYIVNYINELEYSPTIDDIVLDLNIPQTSLLYTLDFLEKNGSIKRDERSARAMRMTLYPSPIDFPKKYEVFPVTQNQVVEE